MAEIKDSRADGYTISQLGSWAGVNPETARYYERVGLMPEPPRTAGGHRVYDGTHLRRLGFIRRSRELGFSLQEVCALLGLVDGGKYTCAEVRDLTLAHLADVRRKIADLKRLERSLRGMAERCTGDLWLPNIPSGRIRRDSERCDVVSIDDRDPESAGVDHWIAVQVA